MSDAQFGITEEPLCQCFGAWHRAIGSETQHGGTEILERILIDGVQLRDDVFPMNDYGHGLIGSVFPVRREERDVPRRILKILGRRFGLFVIPTRAGMTMNAKPSKLFQRSEARRVRKEGDGACNSWWSPNH